MLGRVLVAATDAAEGLRLRVVTLAGAALAKRHWQAAVLRGP